MEDITKPGEEKSNFRPKSSDCGVFIENLTAAWTEVIKSFVLHSDFQSLFLYYELVI